MSHICHAPGCRKHVPPKLFACKDHWFALPKEFRDSIWLEYRPGQENDKRPSLRYLAVQTAARAILAFKPHDEEAARLSADLIVEANRWRSLAIVGGLGDPFDRLPLRWREIPVERDAFGKTEAECVKLREACAQLDLFNAKLEPVVRRIESDRADRKARRR